MSYKIKFTDYQINVFRTLELNGNKLQNMQSVYAYLIKYSENGLVSKSLSRLYKMYDHYHNSICKSYFMQLVNELKDLNLLKKDGRKITIVSEVDKKIDKNMDKFEVPESTENTILESILSKTETQNSNYNTNTNTNNYEVKTSSDTNNFKIATLEELQTIARDLLKDLGIRSKVVKANVMDKINKYVGKIHIDGAISYLKAVVIEAINKNEINRSSFIYNKVCKANRKEEDLRAAKNQNFCEMITRDRSENNTEGNMSWKELENLLLYGQE